MPKSAQTPASVLIALMEEYQLNAFSLSKEINLNQSSVRQLVTGKSKVKVPTALRLAKYFGQTPDYWLDLQRETDFKDAQNDKKLMAIVKGISKAKKPTAKPKAQSKTAKKTTLSDKRKKAAKVPGAKPASRKPASKAKGKK
jgi:addiction module HigA family antidote